MFRATRPLRLTTDSAKVSRHGLGATSGELHPVAHEKPQAHRRVVAGIAIRPTSRPAATAIRNSRDCARPGDAAKTSVSQTQNRRERRNHAIFDPVVQRVTTV